MTELMQRAASAARRLAARHDEPMTRADEASLAEEFDRSRGLDLPRKERSKRRYELGEGAPVLSYTPPQLRG